jgi:putative two-component system response regulator
LSVHILVVDDEPDMRELMLQKFRKKIEKSGYLFEFAANGIEALKILESDDRIDIVITDINMPQLDGLSLLTELKRISRPLRVIIVTAYGDMTNIRVAMNRNAFDFITKPIDFNDLEITIEKTRVSIQEFKATRNELKESFDRLRKNMDQTIEAISRMGEIRDPYTAGHQKQVASLSRAIAVEMGLPQDRINGVYTAALVHDIGKIYVPSEILSKPGSLTENEFNLIKDHTRMGYSILKTIEFPWPVADIVYMHHERLYGSGYPQGLKGDTILLEAQIIIVSDIVEAVSSHRPYRPALGIDRAMEEIESAKGKALNTEIVDICKRIFKEGTFAFETRTK